MFSTKNISNLINLKEKFITYSSQLLIITFKILMLSFYHNHKNDSFHLNIFKYYHHKNYDIFC